MWPDRRRDIPRLECSSSNADARSAACNTCEQSYRRALRHARTDRRAASDTDPNAGIKHSDAHADAAGINEYAPAHVDLAAIADKPALDRDSALAGTERNVDSG